MYVALTQPILNYATGSKPSILVNLPIPLYYVCLKYGVQKPNTIKCPDIMTY